MPSNWTIRNPDDQITWEIADAPDHNPNNDALVLRFFDYEDNFGEQDILYSPIFNLSDADEATLIFDYAHAQFDFSNDRMKVFAITGCSDLENGHIVFDSTGADLATTSSTRVFFKPTDGTDWRRAIIDLTAFTGEQFVQLAFVGVNDFGNNLYLDNISVTTTGLNDLNVLQITEPSIVTCTDDNTPVVRVQNTGTVAITSLAVEYHLNETSGSFTISSLTLDPGEEMDLHLPALTFPEQINNLEVEVVNVNGTSDDNPFNNKVTTKIVYSSATDRIPLRQTFEDDENLWIIVNPRDGMNWQTLDTNFGTSLYFNAFDNTDIGDKAWLVTPVLDFSRTEKAALTFDLSYRQGQENVDDLQIMISTDCGETYELLDFNLRDMEPSSGSWAPQNEDDWFRNVINLNAYAGESSVRIAFVATNGNGNNLYIDNIEFYVTDEPGAIAIDTQYSVFGYNMDNLANSDLKVGFNLTTRQNVNCQIVDRMGRTVAEITWYDVLNQIFDLPISDDLTPGIYIVRLGINYTFFGERIFIGE